MIKIGKEFEDLIPIARMEAVRIAWKYHKKRVNNEDVEDVLSSFLEEFKAIKKTVLSTNNYNKKGISMIFLQELFNELLELGKENH